jgi:hypothetical protein
MFDSVEVFQSDAPHICISRAHGFDGPNALNRLANARSKPFNSEGKRDLESARIVEKGYVPELISPGKVNRGEAYTLHIKGATISHPVAVFIRFMDSSLVFGEAREGFYKRFKEVKTVEGLMRIPGYASHHRLLLAESDTQINLKGSVLVWAAFMDRDSWVGMPFVARYVHEKSNDFEVKE